jgi:hypothetical protein
MSSVDAKDIQFIPSYNAVQLQQPKNDIVAHQPPPDYVEVNRQSMGNSNQIQRQPTLGVHVISGVNSPYPYLNQANTVKVHDYKVWSIFNLVCCCLVLGCCALQMSNKTRTMQRIGDLQGAQKASTQAAILNILATTIGIIIITLAILEYTKQIELSLF